MFKTRLMTGSALFILFVPALFFARPAAFNLLIAGIIGCAAWEWARLLTLRKGYCVSYAFSVSLIFLLLLKLNPAPVLYLTAAIFWLGIAPLALISLQKPKHYRRWRLFLLAAGPLILIASGYALLDARAFSSLSAFSILLFVWAADSGAYVAGKWFGKHKLAPSISPGKSWEGALGGMLLALAAAFALHGFEPSLLTSAIQRLGLLGALVALSALYILSIVGDLFESLLKRQASVKDSSALLPGHGGVLDRIDALLPVLPFALLLVHGM